MDNPQEVLSRVLALKDHRNFMGAAQHPAQGQFVTTGLVAGRDLSRQVGYCVQVRKRCGQFGSDMVFLRHADGGLVTHENQCYYGMTEEQEALARTVFRHLPEDEDYSLGYTCVDKVHEVGFVIDGSASQPCADPAPVSVSFGDGDTRTYIRLV